MQNEPVSPVDNSVETRQTTVTISVDNLWITCGQKFIFQQNTGQKPVWETLLKRLNMRLTVVDKCSVRVLKKRLSEQRQGLILVFVR